MSETDPLKKDFRTFLFAVWRHLQLPDPTPVQQDIAKFLQYGPRRKVIEAFRGVGKSWITSAYVCWRLYCQPDTRILVISASKVKADEFTTFTKRLISEVPFLKHLKPREGQRDSMVSFDVGPSTPHQSPSVKSVGITGQFTGSRAHEIVADDVEVPTNSMTQVMRDRLWEAVKEFDSVLLPGGYITYLGTPQTIMSLYNELPRRGYKVRIWPVRVPNPEDFGDAWDGYLQHLAPFILKQVNDPDRIGKTTEPTRFSDLDVGERELSYGRSGFRLQFMLDTSLSDANRYPLKLHDLMVMSLNNEEAPVKCVWAREPDLMYDDLPMTGLPGDGFYRPMKISRDERGFPTMAPYQGCVMFIDPAGKGQDELALSVVKMLNGTLFLTKSVAFQGGYEDKNLKRICEIAKEQGVNEILVETNWGGSKDDSMFMQLLKPHLKRIYPCTLTPWHSGQVQKEIRAIDTLEPILNQHRLVVDPEVIREDYADQNASQGLEHIQSFMLFYQLTHLTREKGALLHDDRLDALAGAVAYWIEQMAKDAETAEEDHKSQLLEEDLERFMESALGASPKTDTWMSLP